MTDATSPSQSTEATEPCTTASASAANTDPRTDPSKEDRLNRYQALDAALLESIRGGAGLSLDALGQAQGDIALTYVSNVAQAQRLIDRRLQVMRKEELIHSAAMLWRPGPAPGSTPDGAVDLSEPAGLARLCDEVLTWVRTGRLPEHSAFRAYAESEAFAGDADPYQAAERRIQLAALKYVADQRGRAIPDAALTAT